MDWVPIVFIVFKVAVFSTGMFFAIKWHYDQGKKAKNEASRSKCRLNARRVRRTRRLMPCDGLLGNDFYLPARHGARCQIGGSAGLDQSPESHVETVLMAIRRTVPESLAF